jgi:hypothetical protein
MPALDGFKNRAGTDSSGCAAAGSGPDAGHAQRAAFPTGSDLDGKSSGAWCTTLNGGWLIGLLRGARKVGVTTVDEHRTE